MYGSRPLLCSAAVLVLLVTATGAQRPTLESLARSDSPAAQRTARAAPIEQEWIVADIATAVRQMVAFGAGKPRGTPKLRARVVQTSGGAAYEVTGEGSSRATLSVDDYVWSPASFAQLAAPLAGPHSCTVQGVTGAVSALLNPVTEVFVRENDRISRRLQADMRCADAHHEAALLAGMFALREAAGRFTDRRRLISRMTAHLSVAEAVEPSGAGTARRLANAVLLTLVGRQRDALDELARLEATHPEAEVQAWIRGLRLRNTQDWRTLAKGTRLTTFESLSLIRALTISVGDVAALERFDAIEEPADTPDWPRLLTQGEPGVEAGNRFSGYWIPAELADFSTVLDLSGSPPEPAATEAMIAELNVPPGDGPVGGDGIVRVIDRGTWAAAAQRHLMMAIVARHTHLVRRLGLPGDARAFRDDVSRSFSRLTLYPLAATAIAYSRDEVARVFPRAAALVAARPELVTDQAWRTLQAMAAYAVLKPAPDAAAWFRPIVPTGTAFDVESRARPDGATPRLTNVQVAALRERAPYSRQLAVEAARWRGEVSYETLREEYAGLAAYDLHFATELARAAWARPEIYVPLMERVCDISADVGYYELAPYLVDHGRLEEGRLAYERWLSLGRNDVAMSNSMTWLVRHYYEAGDLGRAEEVARRVAETGSFWGLVTRADLHDWRGELDEAEALHRRAWKRYENPNELLAFYVRHGRRGPEVLELTRDVFPAGITHVTAARRGAPHDGVIVIETGATGAAEGLEKNDVIVVVDGIRVGNVAQYRVARGASAEDTMKLTVWRRNKYVEVSARLRYRWIVNSIDVYQPLRSGGRSK